MEMPQTHTAFAAPMKELERLLKSGMLHHGANPILRWCMANLVVKADHDGGLKPDKRRSHEKIDAVVALTMALDGVVRQPLETGLSTTRGVWSLLRTSRDTCGWSKRDRGRGGCAHRDCTGPNQAGDSLFDTDSRQPFFDN